MLSPLELPAVVDELSRLGYQEPDLAKILGGNLMRVARQTWV
jgi:microsomal dipeptidase-like Zn-dependent dipeptidase